VRPLAFVLLASTLACGSGFSAGADDASSDVGSAPDEGADVPLDASAPPDAPMDVRTLDGSAPDVTPDAGDAGEDAPVALCCHIDCNGDADLACDAAGVLCYDAGCMFYMACSGNVEKCP
jgi:hypothetical protein